MDIWEFDRSEPIIAPEAALSYYSELSDGADLTLPSVLVGTFQGIALRHIAARLGVEVTDRWPTSIFYPLARAALRGRDLAIARLPVGAPAAAAALDLMIAAGVRTAFLVGSAGSIQPTLPTGSILVPTSAIRHDGTSHHYLPADEAATPSLRALAALRAVAAARGQSPAEGPVWTTDAIYRECACTVTRLRDRGVMAVEMEAAALFAVARHRGVDAALVAAISDELGDAWKPGFHTMSYTRAILTAADIAIDAAVAL